MAENFRQDLGSITPYAVAVDNGYEGTEAEYNQAITDLGNIQAEATTLPVGSPATASYEDGVLSLGLPLAEYDDSELQNDMSVLEARMDTFSSLTEGSTTGDAELIDIRVGADGVTYSNAGTAVRTQISNLKNDLSGLKIGEIKTSFQSGLYIDSNGNTSSSSNYSASDYIDVDGFGKLYIWYDVADGKAYNCLYDSTKTKIENFKTYSGLNIIDIPSNAKYVRVSEKTTYIPTLKMYTPFEYQHNENVDNIESVFSGLNDATMKAPTLFSGYVKKTDGSDGDSSSFKRTEYIDISAYSKLYVHFDSAIGQGYNAFYQADKTYISGFITTQGMNEITIPSGAVYVRLSEQTANIATMKMYFPELYELEVATQGNANKIGVLANLPTTAKTNIVDSINELNGSTEVVTSLSSYAENKGVIVYTNEWWQYNNANYKHAVVPITKRRNVIEITAGTHDCMLVGLKSYTSASATPPTLSDYWVKFVEVTSGNKLVALVPSDVKYLAINTLYNSESCVADFKMTSTDYDDLIPIAIQEHRLEHLTMSAFNVRDFNTEGGGGDGCPDELVSTNLPLWKEYISKHANADFMGIIEWFPWFDRSQTIDAYETIFKQFYPYKFDFPKVNPVRTILSKHDGIMCNLKDFANVNLGMPMIITQIGSKTVAVVCWLQSNQETEANRILAYQNAITFLNQFDAVIVGGDFNTDDSLDELSTWTDAGYTLGNGGYWGTINTYENLSPNDNIVTKGLIFEDFEKGEKVTSDHYAVKAKLSLEL